MKPITCNGYAIITFLLIILTSSLLYGQSSIVYDVGTLVDIGLGADVCADTVIINGTYSGNGTICNSSIPVELVSFNASVANNKVDLNWKTVTEVNNFGFEIERASSKTTFSLMWKKIGFVEGSGNTTEPKDYKFTDSKPTGGNKFQYRLKQIDYDGKFEYSNIVEINIVIDKFELSQNYPNPFNPSTKINYSIPSNANDQMSSVILKVYDILGNEVITLINEEKAAGVYEIEFDATEIPSGVYFYRLQAGAFTETKKLILLK
jgi:hypothetical protein